MKTLVGIGRHLGKLQLHPYEDRWVLLFHPPGQRNGKTFYLMAEKSRQPQLFATAERP